MPNVLLSVSATSAKCLLLLRLLSDEEHLTTSPVDGRKLAELVTMLLSNDQEEHFLKIEVSDAYLIQMLNQQSNSTCK